MTMPCPPGRCNWVSDSQDPDHYYCLNCQQERWVNGEPQSKSASSPNAVFAFVVFFLLLLALLSDRFQAHKFQPVPTNSVPANAISVEK